MKCPYCNTEMRSGIIQCRDGVFWRPKKSLIAALSGLGRDAVALSNIADGSDSAVRAYNCDSCKLVIVQYGEETAE